MLCLISYKLLRNLAFKLKRKSKLSKKILSLCQFSRYYFRQMTVVLLNCAAKNYIFFK